MIQDVILIHKIFIISFLVMAIWATMWEEAIFGFIREWGDKKIPKKLQQPTYKCSICMCPWYGTPIYWLLWGNTWQEGLIVVLAAMGLNAILIKLFPN